ncbi:MAG: ABC transporter permease [Actinomycetales bacterium]|nr:MAG: ABC transporter permease [Actinomycetales bacterium]
MPWNDIAVTFAALVLALIIGAFLMIITDAEILDKWSYFFARPLDALAASWDKIARAYTALFLGSAGSWSAITDSAAQAAPLICGGLSVGLAFRAGLFNIGAQGQAIMASMFGAWAGFSFIGLPMIIHLPLAIVFGVLAGAFWGGIVGFLKAKTGAHEVIVTIMLNYVANKLLAWLLATPLLQDPNRSDPISPQIAWNATLPRLEGGRLHFGVLLALLAAFAVWWLLERTTLGFQIRAVGTNPHASATAGMSVSYVTVMTMVIAGGLAGLAGVQAALAPSEAGTAIPLSNGLVGTIGFDAITVALLGRSKPFGIVLAGLLFGALEAGGLAMQGAQVSSADLTRVLQAVIVLFIAAPGLVKLLVPFLKVGKVSSVA